MTDLCKLTLDDGTHYDLSSLASSSKDYATILNGTTYSLNPCRTSVVHELWKVDVADPGSVSGYIATLNGDFSLGSLQAQETEKAGSGLRRNEATGDLVMTLGGGTYCSEGSRASTAIRFICSPSTFSAGAPLFVASLPFMYTNPSSEPNPGYPEDLPCSYFFEWSTHLACPTSPSAVWGGHWSHYIWLMGVFVFIAMGAYLLGLVLYKRFVLKQSGRDLLPGLSSFSFLSERPSFDFSSLFGRGSGGRGAGFSSWKPSFGRGGYRNLRPGADGTYATDEEEEALAGGRFSLDDDEEEDARALSGDPSVWRAVGRGPGGTGVQVGKPVEAPPSANAAHDWGGFVSGSGNGTTSGSQAVEPGASLVKL